MRLHLAAIIAIGSLTASTQQPPLLDLTIPYDDGSKVGSGRVSISSRGVLPLTVTITELPDQTYLVRDSFQYEVTVTNHSPAALTIPWSGDPRWQNDVPDSGVFRAGLSLELGSGNGSDHVLTAAAMYGDVASPASVHVLAPGASVRVRASGQWSLSDSRVKLRDYLAQTDGRVHVRATYRLTTGTHSASAPASELRHVTLVFPPPP